jgi:hypothetical protein
MELTMQRHTLVAALVFTLLGSTGSLHAGRARLDAPETVMITLCAKPGADAELTRVIATHWQVARRLDLVQPAPHVTVRTSDRATSCFIDIFTWRDEEIPDNAPAEIKAVWDDMTRLTEAHDGKPGLAIARVALIEPARQP